MAAKIGSSVGSWDRKPKNDSTDIETVQRLLVLASACTGNEALDPGTVDKTIGRDSAKSRTVKAIRAFQRAYGEPPTGLIDPDGTTLRRLNDLVDSRGGSSLEPPWMREARREIGTAEQKGLYANNARILEYVRTFDYLKTPTHKRTVRETKTDPAGKQTVVERQEDTGVRLSDADETPWCACFVNWCLKRAGFPAGRSALAEHWLRYGSPLTFPRLGCITVIYGKPSKSTAGTTSTGFHVGFYVEGQGDRAVLLGGNQGNRVCVKAFVGWSVRGYRWPDPMGVEGDWEIDAGHVYA